MHGCRHFAHSVHTLVRTLAQPLSLPVPLPVTLPVPVPLTQTVRLRRTVPKQQHCTPFTCSFVPRYAKYSPPHPDPNPNPNPSELGFC